jgi:amino acid transporter
MSMSRDGLLPKRFSKVHQNTKHAFLRNNCNWFCSSSSSFVLNLTLVTDLCSITLFAFVLVCAGVLVLQNKRYSSWKIQNPYVNSKFILPVLIVIGLVFALVTTKSDYGFYTNETQINNSADIITSLNKEKLKSVRLFSDG